MRNSFPQWRTVIFIINASKEIIWELLTDFPAYVDWNPFIVKVIGNAGPSQNVLFVARFEAFMVPVVANIMEFEVGKKFSWGGPGISRAKQIFGAEHFFEIEEIAPMQCRFLNCERMDGVIPNAMGPFIEQTRPAYIAMNEALKLRAESI